MDILEVFFEFAEALEREQIPYMLSGSLVMNMYALPRMTRDIDLIVALRTEDVPTLIRIFGTDFYWHEPSMIEEIERKGMFNAIHHLTGVKIDFVVLKNTPFRQSEFARRRKMPIFGKEVWVVSLEDLIISKLIWIQTLQSEVQLRDLRNLLSNPQADKNYLRDWIKNLSLQTFDLL